MAKADVSINLPTEADLEAELANPVVGVIVNRAGEHQRYIRWEEYCRAVKLAINLHGDLDFWRDHLDD